MGTKKARLCRTLDISVFWRKPHPARVWFLLLAQQKVLTCIGKTKQKADPVLRVGLFLAT